MMKVTNYALGLLAAGLLAACAAGPNDNRAAESAQLSANGNQNPDATTQEVEVPITVQKDTATPVNPTGNATNSATATGVAEKVGSGTVSSAVNSAAPYQYNYGN